MLKWGKTIYLVHKKKEKKIKKRIKEKNMQLIYYIRPLSKVCM